MTERERIAHLLRRFGLGAGKYELDRYAALGFDGALNRLVNFDQVDEKFPISPWEFTIDASGMRYFDPFRFASWWGLRMLMTQRPLQEKLTLFWHDHFAVSAEKVFDGPTMLSYMETLRRNSAGNFRTMLHEVSREPAMVLYLDLASNTKRKPNENFGRELLELFTLGQGHYTEKDIREVSRAFTGWAIHYGGLGDERPYEKLVAEAAADKRSIFSFCFVPATHDGGSKTILGKTGEFDGDQVLDMLADMPRTARYIVTKLWEWFAYPNPEPEVVDRLQRVFIDGKLEIKPVLMAIARSDEFWSKKCVLSRAKSPLDFTLGFVRCLGLEDALLTFRGAPGADLKALPNEVKGAGDGVTFLMNQQGLLLLYPPNVGGWEWGANWISSANMTARMKHAEILFRGDDKARPIAQLLAGKLKAEPGADTPEGLARAICAVFDAQLPPEAFQALVQSCGKSGGVGALGEKESASVFLSSVFTLLFAAPEFQLC